MASLRRAAAETPLATAGLTALAILIFLPVFFQLDGRIYSTPSTSFQSDGSLARLPMPVSVLVCAIGVLLLAPAALRDRLTWYLIASVGLMGITTVALEGAVRVDREKFVLLLQFSVPMAGFVLGRSFGGRTASGPVVERAMTCVLAVVVPSQLYATWMSGQTVLSPQFLGFAVYGHRQYVPLMLVACYLIAVCGLWADPRAPRHTRVLLGALAPLIGAYMAASASMLSILTLCAGLFIFTMHRYRIGSAKGPAALCLASTLAAGLVLGNAMTGSQLFRSKFSLGTPTVAVVPPQAPTTVPPLTEVPLSQRTPAVILPALLGEDVGWLARLPPNVAVRVAYWQFYVTGTFSSPSSVLLGHREPPDRSKYPSAHNYYLDLAYTFGVLPLVPILGLIILTTRRVWRQRALVARTSALAGLAATTALLVIADNSIKVGMRQPYSGIITFFVWAYLLSRLEHAPAPATR